VNFLQVFHYGERLRKHALAILQHRHQGLRVQLAVAGSELLAAPAREMHRHGFVGKALEIQRDADTVGRGAAEVAVELHQIVSSKR
jgi:hypothetical protein